MTKDEEFAEWIFDTHIKWEYHMLKKEVEDAI